jgi:serine/threonine-protein kinase
VTKRPPFDPASIPPGTLIAGKYEVGTPIGFGAHSVVYAAMHRLLHRKAAVKILARTDAESVKRFAREARLAGSLDSPNIVEVYEVGMIPDGRAFLAMELLEGETLEERLTRTGPFPIPTSLSITQQLLHALAVAHENRIVHRDLRPDNVFMAMVRGEEVLKVVDFGTSRNFGDDDDSTLTQPGAQLTEVAWMAPEQLFEGGELDHRTDLYAVGVFLYRLLTGRLPFEDKGPALLMKVVQEVPPPPSQFRPELPKDVDRVVLTALSKEKSDRFRDAETMAEALRLASIFASYMA